MNNFKSFSVSTLAAAATLLVVAMSSPAQACALCSGIKLNGSIINGISLQGISLQGISLQGVSLKGAQIQGAQLQRRAGAVTQIGAVHSVTLPQH